MVCLCECSSDMQARLKEEATGYVERYMRKPLKKVFWVMRTVQVEGESRKRRYIAAPRFISTRNQLNPRCFLSAGIPMSPKTRFLGKLYDSPERNQVDAVEKTVAQIRSIGGATLCCPPGFGKTSCAIKIATELGARTLIVVMTSVLVQQWEDRIKQFCECPEEDIQVVLGQSMCKADSSDYEGFGLLVVDEAHQAPADTLIKCIRKANTKYVLGLTATPKRIDGLSKILFASLGPISFYMKTVFTIPTQLHTVHVSEVVAEGGFSEIANQLCDNEARNRAGIRFAKMLYRQGYKKILNLVDRRRHYDHLRKLLPEDIEMGNLQGGCKDPAAELRKPFIVATTGFAAQGVDCPEIDAVFLWAPMAAQIKTNDREGEKDSRLLVQSIGRAMRVHPDKKLPVVVVDFYEPNCRLTRRMYDKRQAFMQSGLFTDFTTSE